MGAAERLVRARLCMAALDYDCAREELALARAAADELGGAERQEALRMSAETALALELPREAERHLVDLLAVAPDFAPPPGAWPPAWREALDRARSLVPDTRPPRLVVEAPARVEVGREAAFRVQAEDRSGVAGVALLVRLPAGAGTGAVRFAMTTTDGRTWLGRVPAELVHGDALAVWIEASDRVGNGPARWGSPEAPQRLPVVRPLPEPTPLLETWWLWTAIGVGAAVVAGVAVGAYYLSEPDRREPASPPRAAIELVWPR